VDFLPRKTVAAVKLYRLFCVDEESVLFDCPAGVNEVELPLITGLETKIFGPRSGTKCNFKELTAALNIIKEAGNSRLLKDYRIRLIQAANIGAISFYLVPVSTGINYPLSGKNPPVLIEVKVGPDYLRDRMMILGSLLAQNKNKLQTVRYIDLRFTEPVIRYNDVK
jgi:hypothetical protein